MRSTCSSPAGWRSCPGTCPPTGSGWWTGRSRGSSAGSPPAGSSRWRRRRSSRPTPRCTRNGSRPNARRRYVSSSRTDEFGLRTVIARVEAGDAVWVEATVARVAEIIAPASPRRFCGRGPVDRVRVAGPPRRAPPAAAGAPRPPRRARPRAQPGDRVPGRPARRPPRRRPVAAGPQDGPLRPPPPSRHPRSRRRGPGRGPRPGDADRAADAARADRADRQAGDRPVRPGPHHRLRTPRVTQGTGPPDHRRRLLALRHLHRRNVDYDHPIAL